MKNIVNEILEKAKVAYKESVLMNNDILEEQLLSIIGNSKLLLELQKTTNIVKIKEVDEDEIKLNAIAKVEKKVPLWLTRPHQKNYKILMIYMELSEYDNHSIFDSLLESESGLNKREFISHYNQMKSFSEKSHGKIFEEQNGEVRLWKPVSKFIINQFQKQNIMDKKRASNTINSSLNHNQLNPTNGGNVKFANKNKSKSVFWINVHLNKISEELHFILNDNDKREFRHLMIPANTLTENLFDVMRDSTNGLDKIVIEISYDLSSDLIDVRSNGTDFDFNKYYSDRYNY